MNKRIFYSSSPSGGDNNSRAVPPPNKKPKKKINFKEKKNNTLHSLNEVENFLNDFKHFKRYVHLYKFFK